MGGGRLVYGTSTGRAIVLDVSTGKVLFDKQVHASELRAFALNPMGNILATGNWQGQIKIWDVDTGMLTKDLFDPPRASFLNSLAFSPTGDRLAAALRHGRRTVWDTTTWEPFELKPIIDNPNGVVTWSIDGNRLASIDGDALAIYERDKAEAATILHHRGLQCVCWLNDKTVITGGADQAIRFWDADRGREIKALHIHYTPVSLVIASDDGKYLASLGGKTLRILRTDRDFGVVPNVASGNSGQNGAIVRWSHNGKMVALGHRSWGEGTEVRVIDAATSTARAACEVKAHVSALGWTIDDQWLIVCTANGIVEKLAAADLSPGKRREENTDGVDGPWPVPAAVSADGRWIARNMCTGLAIEVLDSSSLDLKQTINATGAIGMVWSFDSRKLFIEQRDRRQIWDVENARCATQTIRPSGQERAESMAWDPASIVLALGFDDGTIRLLGAQSLDVFVSMPGHSGPPADTSWSIDGHRIASCGPDGTVRIWDGATGDALATFSLPNLPNLNAVEWSPDGRSLAVASIGGDLYLLEAGQAMQLPARGVLLASGKVWARIQARKSAEGVSAKGLETASSQSTE